MVRLTLFLLDTAITYFLTCHSIKTERNGLMGKDTCH